MPVRVWLRRGVGRSLPASSPGVSWGASGSAGLRSSMGNSHGIMEGAEPLPLLGGEQAGRSLGEVGQHAVGAGAHEAGQRLEDHAIGVQPAVLEDRKSTRLNSSHVRISYAVFCLKKKKNHITTHHAARA